MAQCNGQSRVRIPSHTDHTSSPPNQRISVTRPPPARRRAGINTFALTALSLVLLVSLITPAAAFHRDRYEIRRPAVEQWENDILFDARPAPGAELFKRQFDLGSSSSEKSNPSSKKDDKPSSTIEDNSPSSTDSDDSTDGGIISAPTPTGSNLPKAFDGGLGTNFTQPGCSNFLRNMLGNDTFTKCIPVSILLQNSQSFFAASRSASTLNPLLSQSCNVDQATCSSIIASYALNLRATSACSQDYDRQQPTVRQAYNGLVSYDLLYRAICTKAVPSPANNNSADFCYTDAVTNFTSPTDPYIYYLPLGVSLPATGLPTCSQCLKQTMGIFGAAARNKSQPISLTYASASQQVNMNCGPNFVNETIPAGGTGAGSMVAPNLGWIATTLAVLSATQMLNLL